MKHITSSRLFIAVLALALPLLFAGCPEDGDPVDPTGDIGIYDGTGAWPEFAEAAGAALESLGRDISYFSEADAQAGLTGYSLIVFPGGDPLEMNQALGFTGRANIRSQVQNGGGFIGLGGGAYLAADTMVYAGNGSATQPPIGLYEGSAIGPINVIAPQGNHAMTIVNLLDVRFDPELVGTVESLYRGGPEFLIDTPPFSAISTFTQTGSTSCVIFEHGLGRVALLSYHPEIEEDDPRDGTTFGDDLNDQESEWFWLRHIAEWAIRAI